MGVYDEYDAFLATKQAVYAILYDYDVETRYRGADERGAAIANAIIELVDIGRNGTQTQYNCEVNTIKVGNLKEEESYYTQEYKVSTTVEISQYEILSITGLPDESIITDINGKQKQTFNGKENFIVKIPKSKMNNNINAKIQINAQCKTYPVFYGKTRIEGTQDYAVAYEKFEDIIGQVNLQINVNTGKLVINKTDEETSTPIEGVTFQLLKEDGTVVSNATTDVNGQATFSNLTQGKYKIKEVETKEGYILNDTIFDINIEYNKISTLNITNKHQKGNLLIKKVDKENDEIKLQGVEFELYSEELEKVIGTYTTDEKGEIKINNLRTGTYKVIEKKEKEGYYLNTEEKIIQITSDKTEEVIIENEAKKGQIKVLKLDKENNEIKLQGVTFEVLDEKGNILETITTDENGEAMTSSYAVIYYPKLMIREKETLENYILNEETKVVNLEEEQITSIIFENEKKKGNLEIEKVDKDNNKIKIGGVVFDLYSENLQKVIGTYTTDANGQIKVENLDIGKYKLIEKSTNEWYNLAEEKEVQITWNNTEKVIIENELKKGQIKVIKVDKDNNEVKLQGVKFEVLDENGNILETIITDENGKTMTSSYAIRDYAKLMLIEKETNENYVLNKEPQEIRLEENKITNITFENEKIKGKIGVIKTSQDYNPITGTPEGTPIKDVVFEIYNSNDELVQEIKTNEQGIAITNDLEKGIYIIKEKTAGEFYILNSKEYTAQIKENDQIVELKITNKSEDPSIEIEKQGTKQAEKNQEIEYKFNIKNSGNTAIENFTWYEYLPTDYVRVSGFITGTYNQELNYNIYYKTNKNDYKLLQENLSSKENKFIDFSEINLEEEEYITELKIEFGKVEKGFKSNITPYLYAKVNEDVKNEDLFVNRTKILGSYKGYQIFDEDEQQTNIFEEVVKKLPKTGI